MKKFNVVHHFKYWFTLSGFLVVISLASILMNGFNFGIDFTGGTILDVSFSQPVTVAEVREGLKRENLETSVIQLSGETQEETGKNVMIRTRNLSAEEAQKVVADLSTPENPAEVNRIETVGAVIGSEITKNTLLNVVLSFGFLIAYMSFRFEHRIAISAITAICHDILMVLGVFAFFQLEIDGSFLAAILTVLGYSMNESVVIFDRIRENLHTHRKTDSYEVLANDSIRQTIRRSCYTLTTTMFAVASLYFFGGDTTKNFALVMMIGFISGAYSSICVATSIWVKWHERGNSARNAGLHPAKQKKEPENT